MSSKEISRINQNFSFVLRFLINTGFFFSFWAFYEKKEAEARSSRQERILVGPGILNGVYWRFLGWRAQVKR